MDTVDPGNAGMGTGKLHTGRRLGSGDAQRIGDPGRQRVNRRGDERGSILVLFALTVTLFAVLCAVVIDVGHWWVMGKKTRVAADACALAAAAQLPANWTPPLTDCVIAGVDYATRNPPATA